MTDSVRDEIGRMVDAEEVALERVLNRLLDIAKGSGSDSLFDAGTLLKYKFNELRSKERLLLREDPDARAQMIVTALSLARDLDEFRASPAAGQQPRQPAPGRRRGTIAPPPEETVVVRLKDAGKTLSGGGSVFQLHPTTLAVERGEILSIIGPNGSGKSTLMRILSGTLAIDIGTIEYPAISTRADDWLTIAPRIAYVQQFPKPWERPLLEVLRFTAAISGYRSSRNEQYVKYALARLGLSSHVNKSWTQLSGGFRTRFALARCLVMQPDLVLLDEPLAHLDVVAQAAFLRDLRDVTLDSRFTVIMTSQHIYEAEATSDKVMVLDEGHIVFLGSTAEIRAGADSLFEFGCDGSEEQVAAALAGAKVSSPMPRRYLARAGSDARFHDVLRDLDSAGVSLDYCRDLTRSSRRFLKDTL
jgi:ABC-2 type transport system ATP-binding protein